MYTWDIIKKFFFHCSEHFRTVEKQIKMIEEHQVTYTMINAYLLNLNTLNLGLVE